MDEERISKTFIFHKEWVDSVADMDVEKQDMILADIARFGTGCELKHLDDDTVKLAINLVKSGIERSVNDYETKLKMSKSAGRKKKISDLDIYQIAKENPTYTSSDIANVLGVSKSSVDHSDGWRNRNQEDFLQNCKNL